MTHELTTQPTVQLPSTIADIERLGEWLFKSGWANLAKPEQGPMAVAFCKEEGLTIFQFCRRYHIISGRLSMKSDAMLAEFRARGGQVKWLNAGDDGSEARAVFTLDDNETEIAYTIEDATRAGLSTKENWRKHTGAMLRARLISKAIRMVCPEIVAGLYTPEEVEDFSGPPQRQPEPAALPESKAEERPSPARQPTEAEVIDAEPEPVKSNGQPRIANPHTDPVTQETLVEIRDAMLALGLTKTDIRKTVCAQCQVSDPTEMTEAQGQKLAENAKAELAKREEQTVGK